MDFDAIRTDKKTNARYWDGIDGDIENLIHAIAAKSAKPLSAHMLAAADMAGAVAGIRESLIGWLESAGGEYPTVDEDM